MNETINPSNDEDSNQPTGWEILSQDDDPTLDDKSLTSAERSMRADAERSALFEQYEQQELPGDRFRELASKDIADLYNHFDIDKASPEEQTSFADEIAVGINVHIVSSEITSSSTRDIFDNIKNSYLEAANTARENGKDIAAQSHERQAKATDRVREHFVFQIMEQEGATTNQAAEAQAAETTPDPSNPLSGDAID